MPFAKFGPASFGTISAEIGQAWTDSIEHCTWPVTCETNSASVGPNLCVGSAECACIAEGLHAFALQRTGCVGLGESQRVVTPSHCALVPGAQRVRFGQPRSGLCSHDVSAGESSPVVSTTSVLCVSSPRRRLGQWCSPTSGRRFAERRQPTAPSHGVAARTARV